jgi:outer membrane protein OmpA-like peptidoglycan-associated protein
MSERKKRRNQMVIMGASSVAVITALVTTGLLIAAGSGNGQITTAETGETDWAAIAQEGVDAGGFGFARAEMDGKVLTITGDAPDALARDSAFKAGVEAVQEDRRHIGQVLAFSNAMTIAGAVVASVPDAASALGEAPEAEACQSAFDTLLDGRVINFTSSSALISQDSTQLLDGLSAVAVRCVSYKVQVRGHTDAQGDPAANQALSERRAQAVADYLVRKGVDAAQLGVTGLGETESLDQADTAEANARNRRIEFRVTENTGQ